MLEKAKTIINTICNVYCNIHAESKQMLEEAKEAFIQCLKDLLVKDWTFGMKYIAAPAAKTNHQAHTFGLIEHSFQLCMELAVLAVNRKRNLTATEIARIAFAHDLCKVDTYTVHADKTITYDVDAYKSHAKTSLKIADKYDMQLSYKEKACVLCHMSRWANFEDLLVVVQDIDPELTLIKTIFGYAKEIGDTQEADIAACKQFDFILAFIKED